MGSTVIDKGSVNKCLVKTEGATADHFSTLESKLSLLPTLIAGSCTDILIYMGTSTHHCQKLIFCAS